MASARTKTQAVGSAGWIQNEREQAKEFVDQEVEEFSYSVRNELEWLNEHMAEIFSKNPTNFTDVFKTPGKLRGRTPRTARKRDVLGPRQPLTDIFAPNVPAPPSAQKTAFFDKVAHFQVAEDVAKPAPVSRSANRSRSPQRVGKPGNTDSGYHGMTEDEMDTDGRTETATNSSQQSYLQKVPIREDQPPAQRVVQDGTTETGGTSDDSFMSAKEDQTSRNVSREQLREKEEEDGGASVPEDETEVDKKDDHASATAPAIHDRDAEPIDQDHLDDATSRSASDTSSPYVQRKSSFNFTSLPAREPLTATKSMGARNSQIDMQTARNSTLARSFGGKSLGVAQSEEDEYLEEKSEESKAYNKTSTQLLHERINMLGKTKEPRTSKSIPQSAFGGPPQLPAAAEPSSEAVDDASDDDNDDWIEPTKPVQRKPLPVAKEPADARELSPQRPPMHQKSISTTHIPAPTRSGIEVDGRNQKAISVSNPGFAVGEIQSTTPAGSPLSKKHSGGPLSASKNKLYSVLKSAKSIFASSASASAAAKLEAHNSSPSRSPTRDISNDSKTAAVLNMPGALYSERQLPQSPTRSMISLVSKSPSKKSRNSHESDRKREKDLKEQQKAADGLEKAREKERQKAAEQQAEAAKTVPQQKEAAEPERPKTAGSEQADMPPPPPPKSTLPGGNALRAAGRLVKPTREPQPSKPAPVSIRVASQSQRLGQASNLSKSGYENAAPPPPLKQTGLRPGSAQGRPGSANGSVTAPNNARVKALGAAARKKEADEKVAQRKADQKRELERKRAAKAEEDRKAEEERKAAEQQRLAEAKLAAQRQAEKSAAEAKRREQHRAEQTRQQEEAQRAKAAHELAEAIKRERVQQAPAHPRGDVAGGTLRQVMKNTAPESAQSLRPVQVNQAKPPKRVHPGEEDEEPQRGQPPQLPQRPGLQRGPPSYQPHDAKRRRTNEEDEQPGERRSVMAPPMRPSAMRKESTLAKIPHGYTHAPPPVAHHTASMFKATVTAQHQLIHPSKPGMPAHPSQMVQMSNARIPFAENSNPPGQVQHHGYAQAHPGHENMQPGVVPNKFKTPVRPAQAPKSAKSSPLYPNGDNIQLPEIATDSEDEDSDNEDNTGFRAPSWVASPALRDLLTQQQLVDPETVFGPIGELKMDEVFRNGKNQDRLKKFRDRGSSAAWVESGDAVTSAEKRRDMEMRERVVKEGGWRYEPNA